MENIGQELWNLSIATQFLERKDTEELLSCYGTAFALRNKAQSMAISEVERRWANHLFEDVELEVKRRKLDVFSLFVQMNQNGEFLQGKEELKAFWSMIDFDSMVEIADEMLKNCNEEQRQAILELEREIVVGN